MSVTVPRLKWLRRATLEGSVRGRPALAEWRTVHLASRGGSEGYAAGLSGSVAGGTLDIEAVLRFDPSGYPFSGATVAGELSGLGLEAHVMPTEAIGGALGAYVVSGGLYVGLERLEAKRARFAVAPPMPFAFYVAAGKSPGHFALRGHTSTGAACIDILPTNGPGGPVDISGFFDGPAEVALLLVGTTLQWIIPRPAP